MLPLAAAFALALTFPAAVSAPLAATAPAQPGLAQVLRALDQAAPAAGRAAAIDALAGQPQYVPVFESLVRDPDPALREAAVAALGKTTDATATGALRKIAVTQGEDLAGAALTALGEQQTTFAAETLFDLQQHDGLREARRLRATRVLAERYPHLRTRFPPRPAPPRAGLLPAVLVSGEVGSLGLTALGYLGLNPNLGAKLGAVSGAALGLSAGYLTKRDEPLSAVRGWRYVSYTNWGLAGGLTLSSAWLRDNGSRGFINDRRISMSSAAAGALGGYLAAEFDRAETRFSDQVLVDASGFAGAAVGRALTLWRKDTVPRFRPAGLTVSGALGGLVVSRKLVHRFRLTADDQMLLFSAPLLGTWWSLWSVLTYDPRGAGERVDAWALMGAGGGWFAGLALASQLEIPSETVFTADVGALYGSALGLGAAMVALPMGSDAQARAYSGSLLAGSVGGFGLGILTADRIHLVPPAQLLVLLGTGFGAWQGAGWAIYARPHEPRDNESAGWALIGLPAGGAAALTYALSATVTTPVTLALLSGTAIGTWYGGMGADILQAGQRDTLLACLIGSDADLALTGVLIGPLGVDPKRVGWGGVFGAIGAGLGATGAGFATERRQEIEGAALAGTTVGIAAGAWLAPRLRLPKPRAEAPVSLLGVQPFVAKMDGSSAPGLTLTFAID